MKKESEYRTLARKITTLSLLSLCLTGCNVTINENYAVPGILAFITYILTGPMLPPEGTSDKKHPFDRFE